MSATARRETPRVMRFPGAVRRDPAVDAWLLEQPDELRAIAQFWFDVMRECGDDVRELMHDDQPTACVGDAAFAYVDAFSEHVNVGFYLGAAMADPTRLLQGAGRFMRHVKLRPETDVDTVALRRLIARAYADMKKRLSLPAVR